MPSTISSLRRCLARAACAAIAITLLAAIVQAAPVTFEQSSLTIDAAHDSFEFQVEMAVTPEQRAQGLMFREDLEEGQGMLFDFGRPQHASMWMRNTYVPLDMLFIDADGRITQIAANTQPLSDKVVASREPVRAVLELRGGVSAKLGIKPGDRVIHPLFDGR